MVGGGMPCASESGRGQRAARGGEGDSAGTGSQSHRQRPIRNRRIRQFFYLVRRASAEDQNMGAQEHCSTERASGPRRTDNGVHPSARRMGKTSEGSRRPRSGKDQDEVSVPRTALISGGWDFYVDVRARPASPGAG